MATQITADLPTLDFPREVDYPTQEDWAAFSTAAELNFGILGSSWSTQMQLWKTQANAMSTELNTNATIAQGLANYQGDWISQGYTLGQTVSVGEVYYICKLTHMTGQNPTSGGSAYWNLALGNWNLKVDKVTSSDNSIVRFDGIDGSIQNSQVVIDDNGNMSAEGVIVSYNNFIASTDYTDGNYIRMIRQGSQGLDASLEVVVANTKTLEILPNGSYLSKSYGAIGYGSGAGGIVTQLGSKSAEVALNKQTGIIITHNQTLTAGQSVTFPVYNAYFDSLNDIAYPIVAGSSNYRVESLILASDNKYHIKLTNVSASSLSDSIEIRVIIFKGARQ